MGVEITRTAKQLSDTAAPKKPSLNTLHTFDFDGDNSITAFYLPAGWKPLQVFVDGSLKREGSANDYTVEHNGFKYFIEFAIAPTTVTVAIPAQRIV